MKWIAKRILLTSKEFMPATLIQIIIPFIDELKKNDYIAGWYCSRKIDNDGSEPSIRVYLNIHEEYELTILTILNKLLNENKIIVGWTGKYDTPDPPCPNPARPNLKKIEIGCEISLELLKKYPNPNQLREKKLYVDLISNIKSVRKYIDKKAIHFIANNLNVNEFFIHELLRINKIEI